MLYNLEMRKVLVLLLVFLSVVVLVVRFGSFFLGNYLGGQNHSGIRVESSDAAQVMIDNLGLGQTPVQKEDLPPGDHLIKLQSDKGSWQGYVKSNEGTLSVVNRDLAQSAASSSGEIITLEKGTGATVISTPDGADVSIDGTSLGKTPISVSTLAPGEHTFTVSHANYLIRSVKATSTPGFDLTLSVDLALSEADLTQIQTTPIVSSTELVVTSTPTGFLNIRSQASDTAQQVGRLKPGDSVTLLEELPSWDRIRTSDGTEGYVFSSYVTKKSQ
jgi:hypothetical protein